MTGNFDRLPEDGGKDFQKEFKATRLYIESRVTDGVIMRQIILICCFREMCTGGPEEERLLPDVHIY